jgi:ribose transport system substrate-binding protein
VKNKTATTAWRLSIAAAVTLTGAACGSGTQANSTAAAAKAEPVQWSSSCSAECQKALTLQAAAESVDCKVGISQNSLKHPYGVAQKAGLEDAARRYWPNMKTFATDGQGDAVTQNAQVQDLITKGIDVLVITPLEADALVPAVKAANKAGIKVITHDRSVNTDVLAHIADSNEALGKAAGEYMVKRLGEAGGRVIEISGTLGASATNERSQGFRDAISANPKIKIIATQTGDYARDKGLSVMQDFLQRFPRGKVDAIEEAGRSDEMFVHGLDGGNAGLEAIKAGKQAGTVVYPLNVPEAMAAAAKACAGEELPKVVTLEGPVVTPENIADFIGKGF